MKGGTISIITWPKGFVNLNPQWEAVNDAWDVTVNLKDTGWGEFKFIV